MLPTPRLPALHHPGDLLLKQLRHPNIVELKDVIATVNSPSVYLVLECMDCDLGRYLATCVGASDLHQVKVGTGVCAVFKVNVKNIGIFRTFFVFRSIDASRTHTRSRKGFPSRLDAVGKRREGSKTVDI